MNKPDYKKIRAIIKKHLDLAVDEIVDDLDLDVGYWPTDATGAMVECVIAIIQHQRRINDYHTQEGNFK